MRLLEEYSMIKNNRQAIADALASRRENRGMFGFCADEVRNVVGAVLGFNVDKALEILALLGVVTYLDLEDDEVSYFCSTLGDGELDGDYAYYLSLEWRNDLPQIDFYLLKRLQAHSQSLCSLGIDEEVFIPTLKSEDEPLSLVEIEQYTCSIMSDFASMKESLALWLVLDMLYRAYSYDTAEQCLRGLRIGLGGTSSENALNIARLKAMPKKVLLDELEEEYAERK